MLNDLAQYQTTSSGATKSPILKSNSSTANFEFTQPTKLETHEYNETTFKKILNKNILNFNFNEPIKLNISSKNEFSNIQNTNRNHLIIVDQAPFSVFKSVKSQEHNQEDKSKNNIVVINSNRNHPYNNSIRPSEILNSTQKPIFEIPKPVQATSSILITEKSNKDKKPDERETETVEATEVPQAGTAITTTASGPSVIQTINRNSSSNAILAQIKSLGSNFKSIFVRPKNTRHIDLSSVLQKTTGVLSNKKAPLIDRSSLMDYKQLLTESSITNKILNENKFDHNIIKLLPRIEPKELKNNQSVEDILKKYTFENEVLNKSLMTGTSTPSTSQTVSPKQSKLIDLKSELAQAEKWTCMVCLSKHAFPVEICSICGSSKPFEKPNKTFSSRSIVFSKPVQKETLKNSNIFVDKHSEDILSVLQDEDYYHKKSFLQPKPNPYIKKWTCQHCNFSNDSLKVVCLNCRWVKTATTKAKQGQLLNDTIKSPSKYQLDALDSSYESPMKKGKVEEKSKPESIKPIEVTSDKPSLSALFAKQSSGKWNCDTCLVSNDESVDKCVSCSTARPVAKNNEIKTKTKWTCSTCLTENDESKFKCVCCETSKPGAEKPSALKETKTLLLPPTNPAIKFGIDSSSSTNLSFASSFSSTSSFGVKTDNSSGFSFSKPLVETKNSENSKTETSKPTGFSLSGEGASLFKLPETNKNEEKKTESSIPFKFGSFGDSKEGQKPTEAKPTGIFNFASMPSAADKASTQLSSTPKKDTEKSAENKATSFTPTSFLITPNLNDKKEDKTSSPLSGLLTKPIEENKNNLLFAGYGTNSAIFGQPSVNETSKNPTGLFANILGSEKKDLESPAKTAQVSINSTTTPIRSNFGSSSTSTPLKENFVKIDEEKSTFSIPKLNEAKALETSTPTFGTSLLTQTKTSSDIQPFSFSSLKSNQTQINDFESKKITQTINSSFMNAKADNQTNNLFGLASKSIDEKPNLNLSDSKTNESNSLAQSFKFGPKPVEDKSSLFGTKIADSSSTSLAFAFGTKPSSDKPSIFSTKIGDQSSTGLNFELPQKPSEEKPNFFGGKIGESVPLVPNFGLTPKQNEEKTNLFGTKFIETNSNTSFNLPSKAVNETSSVFGQKIGESNSSNPIFGFNAKPTEETVNIFGPKTNTPAFTSGLFGTKPSAEPIKGLSQTTGTSLFNFNKPAETTTTTPLTTTSNPTTSNQTTSFNFNQTNPTFTPFSSLSTPSTSVGTSIFPTPSDSNSQNKPLGIFGSTPTSSQNEQQKSTFNFNTPNNSFAQTKPQLEKPVDSSFSQSIFASNQNQTFTTNPFSNSTFASPIQTNSNILNQSNSSMMEDSFNEKRKFLNSGQNEQTTPYSFNPSASLNFNFGVQPQNGFMQFSAGSDSSGTQNYSNGRKFLKAKRPKK